MALQFLIVFSGILIVVLAFLSKNDKSTVNLKSRLSSYSKPCQDLLDKFRWQLWAQQILAEKRRTSLVFKISTFAGPLTVLSSKDDIAVVANAPDSRLSLHGFAAYVFQFEYTVRGFVLHDSVRDNGLLPALALSTMTRNIGLVDQHLKSLIVRAWTRQISEGRLLDNGWTRLHAPTTVRNVIASIFCRLFFGDELAQHDQFVSAATGFATDVVATAEVLKYTPEFMKTIAARVLTRGYKNQEYLHQRLISIVEGLMTKHKDSNLDKKQNDTETIMQLIARSAKGKKAFDPDKIVSVILCLWLGSIHQPVMGSIQLLYDLCRYPEYLDALQKEALANPEGLQNLDLNADMPLLDSFLRESNRVRPGEAISLRRKVLAPVALPSGNQLQEGDAVVVSQYTIMQDEKNYANAHLFQGFRFATGHPEQTQTSRFADPDDSYHLWGAGKHVCPGRAIASHVMKLAFSHLLCEYDFRLEKPAARQHFTWGTATVPLPGVKLLIRAKQG